MGQRRKRVALCAGWRASAPVERKRRRGIISAGTSSVRKGDTMTDQTSPIVEMSQPLNAYQQQVSALALLIEPRFVKQDKNVKGDFTSGDYVEFKLREIFGPDNISIEIKSGPELVNISDKESYTRVVIRLWVTFANGRLAYQDSIGVWPLKATHASEGGTLEETAAERYETALKAAMTDAIKGAAERFGNCFRPTSDKTVTAFISERDYKRKHPQALTSKGQAEIKDALYVGEEDNEPQTAPENGHEFNEKAAP